MKFQREIREWRRQCCVELIRETTFKRPQRRRRKEKTLQGFKHLLLLTTLFISPSNFFNANLLLSIQHNSILYFFLSFSKYVTWTTKFDERQRYDIYITNNLEGSWFRDTLLTIQSVCRTNQRSGQQFNRFNEHKKEDDLDFDVNYKTFELDSKRTIDRFY